jgi:hypothetical protein
MDALEIVRRGAATWNAWRAQHPTVIPSLRYADLSTKDLTGIDLSACDLRSASLRGTVLRRASLTDANLTFADLSFADLSGADLTRTNFNSSLLDGTRFTNGTLSGTLFANVNLATARDLESCHHISPSAIDVATFGVSEARIPTAFLLGAGISSLFISYLSDLVHASPQFYSCFISYASADAEFARVLHRELQERGVRTWFAPADLRVGENIRASIQQSINRHDKLLLILSRSSIESEWVRHEVEEALAREAREGGTTILFPIALDHAIFETSEPWTLRIRYRHILSVSNWRDPAALKSSVGRLVRDLALTTATETLEAK